MTMTRPGLAGSPNASRGLVVFHLFQRLDCIHDGHLVLILITDTDKRVNISSPFARAQHVQLLSVERIYMGF
jgi:hypothetical protein